MHFETATRQIPGDAGVWFALARCRHSLGDRGGAIEALREVLRLAPDNAPARRLLRGLENAS